MPPPRRRPATPPTRRPKVAGLHRRADQAEDTHSDSYTDTFADTHTDEGPAAPAFDVPVIGEPQANGHGAGEAETTEKLEEEVRPTPRRRVTVPRTKDPEPEAVAAPVETETEPEPDTTAETDDDVVAEAVGEETPPRLKLLVPAILVVVALLIGGLGVWFMQNLSDARTGVGNDALSDVNSTKDIVGAANTAVTAVLSYKFDDMPAATKRAKEYLVGEAVDQYDKSMKALEADIQNQKLQVVVTPVSVGVVRFSGDEARVLVFADQIGTRADKQPSGGPTQFAMDMRHVDGKWKIVKLDFFEVKK
ncbi:hypothetical protein [Kibdelosporangium phytohabitans]|uniref:Mce-associated membrane protein n=1 Tax=Kibdelosporangium phytohabitans TaxID=860235 RepID=A0A0N9IC01_9PSEU|nr:hypothetical protein [Kibdelosporangium phytohabitans]ALG13923.1 hypothetical protein AOZ06_49925 [Kibdelosporangium phytohabitans]MBE1467140.1 Mce-associated membrane protein [Kibdelosporangium phytohabitans]